MAQQKQNIRALRKRQKLTQTDISEKTGIPLSTYSFKERNADFTDEEKTKLSRILKTSLEYIDWTPDKSNANQDIPYILNTVIKLEAATRVMMRSLADIYANQTNASATKVLSDYQKDVKDEIEVILGELKD